MAVWRRTELRGVGGYLALLGGVPLGGRLLAGGGGVCRLALDPEEGSLDGGPGLGRGSADGLSGTLRRLDGGGLRLLLAPIDADVSGRGAMGLVVGCGGCGARLGSLRGGPRRRGPGQEVGQGLGGRPLIDRGLWLGLHDGQGLVDDLAVLGEHPKRAKHLLAMTDPDGNRRRGTSRGQWLRLAHGRHLPEDPLLLLGDLLRLGLGLLGRRLGDDLLGPHPLLARVLHDRPDAGGADVLEHAEHRGHGRLVVARALGAGHESAGDRRDPPQQDGQRGDEADHVEEPPRAIGQEAEELEQGEHGHGGDAVASGLHDEVAVARDRLLGDYVRAGRVIVGHDDDRADPLGDQRPRGMVARDDVLAPGALVEALEEVVAKVAGGEHAGGGDGEERPDEPHGPAHAGEEHSQEHEDQDDAIDEAPRGARLELLDLWLEPMGVEYLGDGLRGLQLFLAVGWRNGDLLVKVVHVIPGHGHETQPSIGEVVVFMHLSYRVYVSHAHK
jgi:hypothetical protein